MQQLANKTLLDLQFDQFSRQQIVAQLVNASRQKKRLRILDVGGHLGKTREFFPSDEVVVLDLYDIEDDNYVRGNALDLPFKDGDFDVVLSFDVLEHIAEKDRKVFFDEAIRVGSGLIIVTAPFDTELVKESEVEANILYKKIYGEDHPWLMEHIENGLPKLDETLHHLDSKKISYQVYDSNNIFLWKLIIGFLFMCGDSRLPELSRDINRFYNENRQYLGEHTSPSYRKIIYMSKSGEAVSKNVPFSSSIDNTKYAELLTKIQDGMTLILKDKRLSIEQLSELKKAKLTHEKDEKIRSLQAQLALAKSSKLKKATHAVRHTVKRLRAK